jgi:hypothetical protein
LVSLQIGFLSGASQLKEELKRLSGKPKVFVVNSAEVNRKLFANWAKTEWELDAVAPRTGEAYQI